MPKPIKQSDKSFEDLNQLVWQHIYERGWHKNTARGLAISIALEANELLEHYQWREEAVGDKQALGEELADVLIYAFEFAQKNDIDIAAAMEAKLQKAAKKYPAEAFKNKQGDKNDDTWINLKLKHRKQGL